jgi:hypothetical protein
MTTKIPSRQMTSGSATAGQVPVADGAGGASWTDVPGLPGVSLYQTTGTTIPVNVTALTTVLFDTEEYDDLAWHSIVSNTGRITVDFTGRIELIGHVNFNNSGNAVRAVALTKNGTVIKYVETVPAAGGSTLFNKFCLQIVDEVSCAPADYFELKALSNGGAVATATGVSGTSFKARRTK